MNAQEVRLQAIACDNWPKLDADAGGARLEGEDGVVHYLSKQELEIFILGWAKAKNLAN